MHHEPDMRPGLGPRTAEPKDFSVLHRKSEFLTIQSTTGVDIAGFALVPLGTFVVHPDCLVFVRELFDSLYDTPAEKNRLFGLVVPPNTIAVSIAWYNFHVIACEKFEPDEDCKPENIESEFFYQMLCTNVQACYYKEDVREFLAGLTYYPTWKGHKDRDYIREIFNFQMKLGKPYPPGPPEQSRVLQDYKMFSRFCSVAGERVVVDCHNPWARHCEFDYKNGIQTSKSCLDCQTEATQVVKRRKEYLAKQIGQEETENPAGNTPSSSTPANADQIAMDILHLAELSLNIHKPAILVFNRKTGKLLDESNWPKPHELPMFLADHPECNVHGNSALLAQLVLGKGNFEDRIGKGSNSEEVAEEDEVAVCRDLIDLWTPRGNGKSTPLMSSRETPRNPFAAIPTYRLELDLLKLEDLKLDPSSYPSTSETLLTPKLIHTAGPSFQYEQIEEVTDC